jgi:class 3 adenylate cyclase
MGNDEGSTVRELKGHQAVILPMIGEHGGRVIDTAGDGIALAVTALVPAMCARREMSVHQSAGDEAIPLSSSDAA